MSEVLKDLDAVVAVARFAWEGIEHVATTDAQDRLNTRWAQPTAHLLAGAVIQSPTETGMDQFLEDDQAGFRVLFPDGRMVDVICEVVQPNDDEAGEGGSPLGRPGVRVDVPTTRSLTIEG